MQKTVLWELLFCFASDGAQTWRQKRHCKSKQSYDYCFSFYFNGFWRKSDVIQLATSLTFIGSFSCTADPAIIAIVLMVLQNLFSRDFFLTKMFVSKCQLFRRHVSRHFNKFQNITNHYLQKILY